MTAFDPVLRKREAAEVNAANPGPAEARTVSHLHPAGSFDVDSHLLPSGREEVWRFTPLDRVEALLKDPPAGVIEITGDGLGPLPTLAIGQTPRGTVLTPTDRAAALASAHTAAAAHVLIPAGQRLEEPLRLSLRAADPEAVVTGHLVIEAGPGSQAVIVLHHTGAARYLGNVEVSVGDEARVTVVSLQDWDHTAVHLGQHEARVGRRGEYRHIAVSLGGDLIRLQNNVSYAGSGGAAQLFGVYFADAGQHIEHRLFVDHNHPKGTSLVDYRGALQGQHARSVWVGDVLIRPEAKGIDTYESNKNLVLSEGCRADAVPNLEIETGEIQGAGHSASTGRFDEEQLFYLRSRGLDEAAARRLVVRGFFAQLVARIGVSDVEEALMAKIDRELDQAERSRPLKGA
ncbi:MAG: Fe-S cluster assembly protein SufD [Propionibacteriaceae bacterium]|jgi:Fe-S cluster assembly protein SufD|nr:Fe-S cluster assembly protein SufD [Propionibacteriaceae bacterium]